jgi:hypothetical protein|nr:MAG TPA: hypothetical protein [Caudoviricetes sp.]
MIEHRENFDDKEKSDTDFVTREEFANMEFLTVMNFFKSLEGGRTKLDHPFSHSDRWR